MQNTVLITGATSGFGRACAEKFGHNEWRLVLIGRRQDRLAELERQLCKKTHVHTIALDIRDRNVVLKELHNLPEPFCEIDVLINNAGLALGVTPAHKSNLDDWETMIDTNIKGLVYCTHCILPQMVKRNHGHVVNIGSIAGQWPYPNINAYGASKSFVRQFSFNLRADLFGTKVRVSLIEPGMGDSEFALVRLKGDEKKARELLQNAEVLKPVDIAEAVFWTVNLPQHVNVNTLQIMPTSQSWGPLVIHRGS
jgi:3-hydroxy acid dehydrogenase / malonic semialdehyde reductase